MRKLGFGPDKERGFYPPQILTDRLWEFQFADQLVDIASTAFWGVGLAIAKLNVAF